MHILSPPSPIKVDWIRIVFEMLVFLSFTFSQGSFSQGGLEAMCLNKNM